MGAPDSPPNARISRAASSLRTHALGLPETTEDFPWGHSAFKVRGKAFVFLVASGDGLKLSVKLPSSGFEALALPFASPTGYGLGKSGWVSAGLGPRDEIPVELLMEWIDESYRAIAPKTLARELDTAQRSEQTQADAGATPVSPKRKAKRRVAKGTLEKRSAAKKKPASKQKRPPVKKTAKKKTAKKKTAKKKTAKRRAAAKKAPRKPNRQRRRTSVRKKA